MYPIIVLYHSALFFLNLNLETSLLWSTINYEKRGNMTQPRTYFQSLRHCFPSWPRPVATLWFVSCCWTLWPMCISGVLSTKNHCRSLSMVKTCQKRWTPTFHNQLWNGRSICMPVCIPFHFVNHQMLGVIQLLDRHLGRSAIFFCHIVFVGGLDVFPLVVYRHSGGQDPDFVG